MSFYIQGFGKVNTDIDSAIFTTQSSPMTNSKPAILAKTIGSFRSYNYYSNVDGLDDILEEGYFDTVRFYFQVGDIITCRSEDDNLTFSLIVSTVNTQAPYIITQRLNVGIGPVATDRFDDSSVIYEKIQNVTPNKLIGNPSAAAVSPSEISLSNGLEFSIDTFVQVKHNLLVHESGTIAAAEWNDMFNTPVLLVAPAQAGKMHLVDRIILRQIYAGAQYAGGGTVVIGYDDEPEGLSEPATLTNISAAVINNINATSAISRLGFEASPIFTDNALGMGIYISNTTGVFTTGTGNWEYNIWYRTV